MSGIKVVVIGGGSSYTPELAEGFIMNHDQFPVEELVFVDIEEGLDKLHITTDLVKRMVQKASVALRVSSTLDREAALAGADFVLTQFRVGGLKARSLDEAIPLSYGVVGQETTGAGGFAKALRTIPVILDIAHDMERLCPEAWLINFTNPSGILTQAVNRHSKIKCLGLCNVPINMHVDVANKLHEEPRHVMPTFVGLNHLSVMTHAYVGGTDRIKESFETAAEGDALVQNITPHEGMARLERLFNVKMSPYLQYFYFTKSMIKEEQEQVASGKGTRAQAVMAVEKALFQVYQDPNLMTKPEALSQRGGARYSEAAVNLIISLHNDIQDVQVVNVLNAGALAELRADDAVEISCVIGKEGAKPIKGLSLPPVICGLVKQVKAYESLTIEAAMTGNRETALQALLLNPLSGDAHEAERMLQDLLEAHRAYLPQFFKHEE